LKVWKPGGRAFFFAGIGSTFISPKQGCCKSRAIRFKPAPGGGRFVKDRVYCVSLQDEKLLVGSAEGLFVQEADSFKPYPTEADAILREADPYRAARSREEDWWWRRYAAALSC